MKYFSLISLCVGFLLGCGGYAPVTRDHLDDKLKMNEEKTSKKFVALTHSAEQEAQKNARRDHALAIAAEQTDSMVIENRGRLDEHDSLHASLGLKALADIYNSGSDDEKRAAQVVSRGELEMRQGMLHDRVAKAGEDLRAKLDEELKGYVKKDELVVMARKGLKDDFVQPDRFSAALRDRDLHRARLEADIAGKVGDKDLRAKLKGYVTDDRLDEYGFARTSELEKLKRESLKSQNRFRLYKECREEKGSGWIIQKVRDHAYLDADAGGPEWYRWRWAENSPERCELQALLCEKQWNGRVYERRWVWVTTAGQDGDNIKLPLLTGYDTKIYAPHFPARKQYRDGVIPHCDRPGRRTSPTGKKIYGGSCFAPQYPLRRKDIAGNEVGSRSWSQRKVLEKRYTRSAFVMNQQGWPTK